jgi:peptidoglycan-associated lipoprotein
MTQTMQKLAIGFLAIFILSGCSSKKLNTGSMGSEVESSLQADFEKNVGDRVFFAFDKSDLSRCAKVQLEKQVAWLVSHPTTKATIEGHCDELGTRDYNIALGNRRADAVKHFLKHKGIDANRLETISYGKERPAVIGNDEKSRAQNRRGVTIVR